MNQAMRDVQTLGLILANKLTTPEIDSDSWDRIYELAGKQWLIGALAIAINKLPSELKPKEIQLIECAHEVLKFQAEREAHIKKEIDQINKLLKPYGPILWLKGGDDLLQEISETAGERWMMDLDCLVPLNNIKKAWYELQKNDYSLQLPDELKAFDWAQNNWHQAPRLVHANEIIALELHRYIGRLNTRKLLPEAFCDENIKPVKDWRHQNCYVLNSNQGLIHRILHTQIMDGNQENYIFNLRYYFHIFLYVKKHNNEIDWNKVEKTLTENGHDKAYKIVVFILGSFFDYITPAFDPNCRDGRDFIFNASKRHNPALLNRLKKHSSALMLVVTTVLSTQEVVRSYGKKPTNIIEWVWAYIKRIAKLSVLVFMPSKWKWRLGHSKKYDW